MSEAERRWQIILTRQAEKTLHRLPKPLLHRIDQVLLALTEHPHPAESHPLAGYDNLYRLPVEEWRITYAVEAERLIILILEIASKQQPERYRLEEEIDESSSTTPDLVSPETAGHLQVLREDFYKALTGQVGEVYFRTTGAFGSGSEFSELVNFIGQTRRKILFLIVDHLPESREYLEALVLSQPDMEVVGTATNGEEAYQKAAELRPDMMLMDTSLPGVDGITVCEEIVKQMPSLQVILISAWGTDDYVRRALLAGAKEFVVKPFSAEELLRIIREVYQKRERFAPAIDAVQEKIRVLIVDDLPETRANLRKLLYFEPDIEVVGAAANGEEAIQMAVELQPDVVLMDLVLPGINGITATEIISQQVPSAQIIVMSVHGEADYFRRAMAAGAREFLIKPFSGDELVSSIRRVYQTVALQKRQAAALHSSLRDAFKELKERLQAKLAAELDPTMDASRPDKARQLIRDKFEQILAQENIILSRSERERLFEDMMNEILGSVGASPRTGRASLRAYQAALKLSQLNQGLEEEAALDETQKRTLGQWFKFYKLGHHVEISLSVADLSESLSFYEKLGLERVDGGKKPYPWAVVSDGLLHLGLHQQVFSSPTLSYFALHMLSERMDHLPKLGIVLDNLQRFQRIVGMYNSELLHKLHFVTGEFASPEGQRVLLADLASDVETTPAGRKFLSRYGTFSELSLRTEDVKAAVTFWGQLGFDCVAEGDQPYPWIIVSDGRIRLGFHQTPKLTKPTITYFAPDMPDRLKRLRKKGVKFLAEHKGKKGRRVGAVIESPDGQPILLLSCAASQEK